MSCPHLVESKINLCDAVDGLFHPSVIEEQVFCKRKNHVYCGIFRFISHTSEKVSKNYYMEQIQDMNFEDSVIYF